MKSLEILKVHLSDILIQNNGDVKLSEHRDVINDAKELGIDERQLSKLLQEVDSSINWDYIRKQKEDAIAREEQLKKDIEEQKKRELNAGETLNFIIEQCSKENVFDANKVKVFFETSDELNQDERKSAQLLKNYFDKNNYIPLTTPKGTSLRLSLQSTNWYKDKLPPPPSPPPAAFPWKQIVTAVSLILIVGSGIGYFFWLKPYLKDKNATRMYTYVDNLSLRSTPQAGVDYNFVDKLSYGSELLVYQNTGEWATVNANKKEGYVSTKFLLPKKDFYELNGMFGDADSKEAISTSKCRNAMLNYYHQKNIIGKIEPDVQKEIFDSLQTKEVWQIFSKGKDIIPNTIIFPRVVNSNSKFSDFGFIIKNITSNKRKFILFSFADDETPNFVFEADAPDEGYIKSVKKNNIGSDPAYSVSYTQ